MTPAYNANRSFAKGIPPARVGQSSRNVGDIIRIVDDRVDAWFEPLRGNAVIDATAKVISGLGDRGLLWAISAAWQARHPGARRHRAVRALAVAGAESSVVNAALKALVGRQRPNREDLRLGDNFIPLREPTSTSFPSGHTLAAFCAAAVLSESDDALGTALLFTGAGLIGISRIHLRAHHASDVLGGMAIGIVLGRVARRLV